MEETLSGGYINAVVRIDSTVRRSIGPRSHFVHQLLRFFEENGIDGAPRFLGIDDQGREILSYIDGFCPHDGAERREYVLSDDSLIEVFRMLRRFHDATVESELAANEEVVLYGDPAPRNTIYRDGSPVAFIDWDRARPGRRIHDVAQGIWQWLDMGSLENRDIADMERRVPMLVEAYGLTDRDKLIEEILSIQMRVIKNLRQQLSGETAVVHQQADKALASVVRERDWLIEHRSTLELALQ